MIRTYGKHWKCNPCWKCCKRGMAERNGNGNKKTRGRVWWGIMEGSCLWQRRLWIIGMDFGLRFARIMSEIAVEDKRLGRAQTRVTMHEKQKKNHETRAFLSNVAARPPPLQFLGAPHHNVIINHHCSRGARGPPPNRFHRLCLP